MRRMLRRGWWSWENFTLAALLVVSLPSLDGAWESGGTSGVWRAVAAWYVVVASGVLIIQPARISLIQTVAWFALAAGCATYTLSSAVWPFWAVLTAGALTQGIRTAFGRRQPYVETEHA